MRLQQLELFHGAVLCRLMRESPPGTTAIRLFEHQSEERAVYKVDGLPGFPDEAYFYLKYCATPKTRKRTESTSWSFTFAREHREQLGRLRRNGGARFLALVCGQSDLKGSDAPMCIGLVKDEEIESLLKDSSIGS
ncbi:MAG: hypothetical protein ACRD2Z_14590 [Thermoanaerobaculia bacterium]